MKDLHDLAHTLDRVDGLRSRAVTSIEVLQPVSVHKPRQPGNPGAKRKGESKRVRALQAAFKDNPEGNEKLSPEAIEARVKVAVKAKRAQALEDSEHLREPLIKALRQSQGTLKGAARWLNQWGVPTIKGGEWRDTTLVRLLPRLGIDPNDYRD